MTRFMKDKRDEIRTRLEDIRADELQEILDEFDRLEFEYDEKSKHRLQTICELREHVEELRTERDTARREAERVRSLREWCSCCGEVRELHGEYGCEVFEASGCFQETFGDVHFPWEIR